MDGDKRLSKPARRATAHATTLGVSAISVWEVARLVAHGRLRFKDHDVKAWIREALAVDRVELLPLSPDVAL